MPFLKSVFEEKYYKTYNDFKDKYEISIDKAIDKKFAIKYYKNDFIQIMQENIYSKYRIFGHDFFLKIMNFQKLGFDFQTSFNETNKYYLKMYEENIFLPEYLKFIDKPIKKIIEDTAEFMAYNDFYTDFDKEFTKSDKVFSDNIINIRLSFLKGYNGTKEKIMKDDDYQRLYTYTLHLAEKEQLPEKIIAIDNIKITNSALIYTYYLIHKDLFGTLRIKDFFIDFLINVFVQLKGYEYGTLKTKFSVCPKKYPF